MRDGAPPLPENFCEAQPGAAPLAVPSAALTAAPDPQACDLEVGGAAGTAETDGHVTVTCDAT